MPFLGTSRAGRLDIGFTRNLSAPLPATNTRRSLSSYVMPSETRLASINRDSLRLWHPGLIFYRVLELDMAQHPLLIDFLTTACAMSLLNRHPIPRLDPLKSELWVPPIT